MTRKKTKRPYKMESNFLFQNMLLLSNNGWIVVRFNLYSNLARKETQIKSCVFIFRLHFTLLVSIFKRKKKAHFSRYTCNAQCRAFRGILANFVFLSSRGGSAFHLLPSWHWDSVAQHCEDVPIFMTLIRCVERVCTKMLISKGFLSTLSLLWYFIV